MGHASSIVCRSSAVTDGCGASSRVSGRIQMRSVPPTGNAMSGDGRPLRSENANPYASEWLYISAAHGL